MSLKQQAFKGLIWTFIEQFGGQLINFTVNIFLARTLFPDDFGLIGILFVFITLSNVLVDGGMKTSLIRKKETNESDYSSVFFGNIVLSSFVYLIIFFAAPFIADFYTLPQSKLLLRVFSLTILFQSFVFVQSAILTKNLDFKKLSLLKLPAIALSSIIGLALAYLKFGVWSLIWMYLSQTFFWCLFHWIYSEWKPKFSLFDKTLFKYHFNFGYKLSITEIINALIANIYQITIGRFYSVLNVGYYTQSLTLRQLPISNIYGPASKLALPVFSAIRDDSAKLRSTFIQIISMLIAILSPILFFLAIFAEPILVLLYSEKWNVAAPYLLHLAIAGTFNVICSFSLVVLNIIKGSKLLLKIELITKGQIIILVLMTIVFQQPLVYLLYSISLSAIISFLIVSYFTAQSIELNFFKLLIVQTKILTTSLFGILISYFVYLLLINQDFNKSISLLISLLMSMVLCMGFTFIFNKSIPTTILSFIKNGKKINSF